MYNDLIIIWGSTGEKGEMMVMGQCKLYGTKNWEAYNDFISSPSSKPQTCTDSVGGSTCRT